MNKRAGRSPRSVPPKVLEAIRRHFGVSDRVLDVLVPEVVLRGPCVVAEATGMAKHVRVDREWHLGGLADALDEAVETDGADWSAAGNPAGRLRGSRNRLSEAVICALLRDFSKHGEKLSADGRVVMLGASNDNGGLGAAWVFTRSGGYWTVDLVASIAIMPNKS
jgi:hypothetical protein